MTPSTLSYAVVTPVRNEGVNLERLATSLRRQRLPPTQWLIVDTGSTDGTDALARQLAERTAWISALAVDGGQLARGGPIVRAFEAGVAALDRRPDVIAKVDADISFGDDYFEQLLMRFALDPRLGMASGTLYERDCGAWRERHVTGSTVWGAARAYRSACLHDVLPLEQRMGWDGVDEFRANTRGWSTKVFRELEIRHHRREGERDGSARRARRAQGEASRYLGYRFWYLALRSLWHARREPAALAMIYGYFTAAARRQPQLADADARAYVRRQQSLRSLPRRAIEAAGRRPRVPRRPLDA